MIRSGTGGRETDPRSRLLAFILLPLAAVPRLWAMWFDQGVFWPDEIYQTIEQAHRLAFGYGMVPWEFRDGARSWVFPGMLGGLLKVASWVGLDSGPCLVRVAKTAMVLLGLLGIYSSMRLAEKLGGRYGALFAGTMGALFPASLVYGARCMTEMAAGPLIVTAAWLSLEGGRRRLLIAGALAGLAIYVRYQSGLFGLGIFLSLLFARRWKDTLWFTLSATILGIAGGVLDHFVWGRLFHSFRLYLQFNVVEGKAAQWGVSDFGYYFHITWNSTGWPLVLMCIGFALSFATRARVLMIVTLVYVMAHEYIPHKEFRFMMPIVPLVMGLAGGGLGLAFERMRGVRWSGWAATVVAMGIGVLCMRKTQTITFEDMGQYVGGADGKWRPWHHEEGPNLAFWEAGKHPDLCGIVMTGTPLISTGGYSYLHKDVAILGSFSPTDLAAANYLAVPRLTAPPEGYRIVSAYPDTAPGIGGYVLFRRDGPCAPRPPWFVQAFP